MDTHEAVSLVDTLVSRRKPTESFNDVLTQYIQNIVSVHDTMYSSTPQKRRWKMSLLTPQELSWRYRNNCLYILGRYESPEFFDTIYYFSTGKPADKLYYIVRDVELLDTTTIRELVQASYNRFDSYYELCKWIEEQGPTGLN